MNAISHPPAPAPSAFDAVYFVTLWLKDALPASFGQNLGLQYYAKQVEFDRFPDREIRLQQVRKRLFARLDEVLDAEKYGRPHFRIPALEQIVTDEILAGHGSGYYLLAFSVLPNHVHLLIELPQAPAYHPPLDVLEGIDFEPLRAQVSRFKAATEAPLENALKQSGGHIDPGIFQKHGISGTVELDQPIWQEQSFDFRIYDAAEYEKAVRYVNGVARF